MICSGIYRFAEVRTEITSQYPYLHRLCAPYASEGPAELQIRTEAGDILAEGRRSEAGEAPADRLEALAAFRKMAEAMPAFGAFLFHCSAVAVEGKGYLFAAPSGTGKSTHTRLWRELLGERAVMINDDKPLIRVAEDGAARVYGTPWDGKHHLSTNISAPVRGICLLERGAENRILRISREEARAGLLRQCYRPENPESLRRTLELLEKMQTDFFRLWCRPEKAAAELAWRCMGE